jgi:ubiquinone/menaquinone biosynthesis C-methylase UbiE
MSEQNTGPSLPSTLYDEEYFLTACEGYEEFIESEGQHLSRRLKHSFELADVRPGMRILDVGCGRGEIVRHCIRLGIEAYGIDYAEVATGMTRRIIERESADNPAPVRAGVSLADAKKLPFPTGYFDRVLMYDVVEHLYPWELHQALLDTHRVLKPDGKFIMHTAPNRWYDQYTYPWVRRFRIAAGQGAAYPKDPRAITPVNQHVHVNEQSPLSMYLTMRAAGFRARVWLDSPPQNRDESAILAGLRRIAFGMPPFRWFFERELFAVGEKAR